MYLLCYIILVLGPLAHLVERTHGMGEVSGSSPLWSTASLLAPFGAP